jgi:hypothetical protein
MVLILLFSLTSQKENVDEDILSLGALGESSPFSVELDLMQPLDANKAPKVWCDYMMPQNSFCRNIFINK